ncbi:MAG: HAMP domain-containing histidine kinase [Ekhidna sp.]|nr:HAMP domain-containing histidine kinase [Ekhidna sp.]
MKRMTLKWIIGLMGLAMIGLISFQLYWIDNLISANEERFQKDVLDALNTVSDKLEKQETINAFKKLNHLSRAQVYDTALDKYQALRTPYRRTPPPQTEFTQQGSQQVFIIEDSIYGATMEVVFSMGRMDNYFFQKFNPKPPHEEELLERNLRIRALEDKLAKVSHRYEQTFEVVNKLMGSQQPLANRLNPYHLDSLLEKELTSRRIDIEYEYGVFQPRLKQFLFLTENSEPHELASSELKASLFPNDLFGNDSQIAIKFPDKRGFLMKKVWSAMTTSGVLVLVILFCFGYSIRTIVRQKKLSEMKNDFINNMTHELKTPISTVSLAVEALSDSEIERSDLREKYIHVIGEENKRLGEQVEKVLQIAAIDRNDFNLKETMLSMREMMQNAADHILMQVDQRGGRINLIDGSQKDLIKGDEMHITNIIINLLDNANKYSPEAPNITLKADSDDDNFYLSIQDRGIGMTRDQQKCIFEKFYRVPTGDLHNVKGFGLGLAYVQKIVAAHGGSIDVNSELGKGSKFSIKLPLAKNEA